MIIRVDLSQTEENMAEPPSSSSKLNTGGSTNTGSSSTLGLYYFYLFLFLASKKPRWADVEDDDDYIMPLLSYKSQSSKLIKDSSKSQKTTLWGGEDRRILKNSSRVSTFVKGGVNPVMSSTPIKQIRAAAPPLGEIMYMYDPVSSNCRNPVAEGTSQSLTKDENPIMKKSSWDLDGVSSNQNVLPVANDAIFKPSESKTNISQQFQKNLNQLNNPQILKSTLNPQSNQQQTQNIISKPNEHISPTTQQPIKERGRTRSSSLSSSSSLRDRQVNRRRDGRTKGRKKVSLAESPSSSFSSSPAMETQQVKYTKTSRVSPSLSSNTFTPKQQQQQQPNSSSYIEPIKDNEIMPAISLPNNVNVDINANAADVNCRRLMRTPWPTSSSSSSSSIKENNPQKLDQDTSNTLLQSDQDGKRISIMSNKSESLSMSPPHQKLDPSSSGAVVPGVSSHSTEAAAARKRIAQSIREREEKEAKERLERALQRLAALHLSDPMSSAAVAPAMQSDDDAGMKKSQTSDEIPSSSSPATMKILQDESNNDQQKQQESNVETNATTSSVDQSKNLNQFNDNSNNTTVSSPTLPAASTTSLTQPPNASSRSIMTILSRPRVLPSSLPLSPTAPIRPTLPPPPSNGLKSFYHASVKAVLAPAAAVPIPSPQLLPSSHSDRYLDMDTENNTCTTSNETQVAVKDDNLIQECINAPIVTVSDEPALEEIIEKTDSSNTNEATLVQKHRQHANTQESKKKRNTQGQKQSHTTLNNLAVDNNQNKQMTEINAQPRTTRQVLDSEKRKSNNNNTSKSTKAIKLTKTRENNIKNKDSCNTKDMNDAQVNSEPLQFVRELNSASSESQTVNSTIKNTTQNLKSNNEHAIVIGSRRKKQKDETPPSKNRSSKKEAKEETDETKNIVNKATSLSTQPIPASPSDAKSSVMRPPLMYIHINAPTQQHQQMQTSCISEKQNMNNNKNNKDQDNITTKSNKIDNQPTVDKIPVLPPSNRKKKQFDTPIGNKHFKDTSFLKQTPDISDSKDEESNLGPTDIHMNYSKNSNTNSKDIISSRPPSNISSKKDKKNDEKRTKPPHKQNIFHEKSDNIHKNSKNRDEENGGNTTRPSNMVSGHMRPAILTHSLCP